MKYCICNVVCANLMKSPDHKGELHTQLLRGDKMRVLDQFGHHWIYVALEDKHTKGWILKSQCKEVEEASFSIPERFILYGNEPGIKIGNQELDCLHGTFLSADFDLSAVKSQNIWALESVEFNAQNKTKVLDIFLKAPYMWGGATHLGIDCSGLSKMFYRFFGIALPHLASAQMTFGIEPSSLQEVQYGDLAFFRNDSGYINHVGIMRNEGEIVHASESNGAVGIDKVDKNGIVHKHSGMQSHKIHCIKRVLEVS